MTKKADRQLKPRNWALVFISSLLIIIGAAIFLFGITNYQTLGWSTIFICLVGAGTVAAAVTSIIKNDPSWILIDLIIPG